MVILCTVNKMAATEQKATHDNKENNLLGKCQRATHNETIFQKSILLNTFRKFYADKSTCRKERTELVRRSGRMAKRKFSPDYKTGWMFMAH